MAANWPAMSVQMESKEERDKRRHEYNEKKELEALRRVFDSSES